MIRDLRRKSVPKGSKWDVNRIDSVIISERFRSLQQFFKKQNQRENTIPRYSKSDSDGDGAEGTISQEEKVGLYLFLFGGFVPRGVQETLSYTIPVCEFSQLLPGVMQDPTPQTQAHKVVLLNKYLAGNFTLINAHRPLCLFLPNNSNTIAELPESCKFTGTSLNLPGQSRIPSDTSNSVQELCGFHLHGSPCSKRSKPP